MTNTANSTPRTYGEAIALGYTVAAYTRFRGYISRRVDPAAQPVKVAGGSRAGALFVELPAWDSTQYARRAYLVKEA